MVLPPLLRNSIQDLAGIPVDEVESEGFGALADPADY
jgi:hypothetical protein